MVTLSAEMDKMVGRGAGRRCDCLGISTRFHALGPMGLNMRTGYPKVEFSAHLLYHPWNSKPPCASRFDSRRLMPCNKPRGGTRSKKRVEHAGMVIRSLLFRPRLVIRNTKTDPERISADGIAWVELSANPLIYLAGVADQISHDSVRSGPLPILEDKSARTQKSWLAGDIGDFALRLGNARFLLVSPARLMSISDHCKSSAGFGA
ncbi:unnamed protein product [Mycena citricolor]|uniref:Uncharacterized protein n=1 Tax=Mycena citricolor TaxID=2018698 RepID=A0AAD2GY08_9AGAR|nr:unnamed protein product [Mycena citricolor]